MCHNPMIRMLFLPNRGNHIFLFAGCDDYNGQIVSGRCLFKADSSVFEGGVTFDQAYELCEMLGGTTIVVDNVEVKDWIKRTGQRKGHWIWAKVVQ